MPDDYFVSVLREQYLLLEPSVRKEKIRELVRESKENEKFIREQFPDLFSEAFPSSERLTAAGLPSVPDAPPELAAKRR